MARNGRDKTMNQKKRKHKGWKSYCNKKRRDKNDKT
jgi:hypothetical protein